MFFLVFGLLTLMLCPASFHYVEFCFVLICSNAAWPGLVGSDLFDSFLFCSVSALYCPVISYTLLCSAVFCFVPFCCALFCSVPF